MQWEMIRAAAAGHPSACAALLWDASVDDIGALATLLLLDPTSHPTAALVAIGWEVVAGTTSFQSVLPQPPMYAALAPLVAPALAAWRADPQWLNDAVRAAEEWRFARRDVSQDRVRWRLARGVTQATGALRAHGDALRDAVAVVLRDGDRVAIRRCLASLDADAWRTLDDALRQALLAQATPDELGSVWDALSAVQHTQMVNAAAQSPDGAAQLIGAIGPKAWQEVHSVLRDVLIKSAVRDPQNVFLAAPAWTGMTDAERQTLTEAVIRRNNALGAAYFLESLGIDGRRLLTPEQRAHLYDCAQTYAPWNVTLMRIADDGWNALSPQARRTEIAAAERDSWRIAPLLCAIGATRWRVMEQEERDRLTAIVRRTPLALFDCDPALWAVFAKDCLPSPIDASLAATEYWPADDGAADLSGLSEAHRVFFRAFAPWRKKDAARQSARALRLLDDWNNMKDDDRVALATHYPPVLAIVAAAAQIGDKRSAGNDRNAVVDAVGETFARVAAATGGADVARRAVAAMLDATNRWRPWMGDFAPNDTDPPEMRDAWRRAVRNGVVLDSDICVRFASRHSRTTMQNSAGIRAR